MSYLAKVGDGATLYLAKVRYLNSVLYILSYLAEMGDGATLLGYGLIPRYGAID